MNYGSVCSGIEAATAAWHPLGWRPAWFSEIERFPSAVLAHRYPNVPNLGDMTRFQEWPDAALDVLVGGTPCQSFSVAGLRGGLADPRGNLMLTFGAIAERYRPEWLVWENVPGVLSSNGGRDFGTFLGMLGELGYGFAYRVLDAQFFGVAQRRRRVFVVANARSWRRAAAVLFERHSLSGHPAPRREAGEGSAAGTLAGTSPGGGWRIGPDEAAAGHLIASTGDVSHCLNAGGMGRQDYETETLVAHSLRGEGFDASEDGTGRGTPLVPVAVGVDAYNGALTGPVAATLGTRGSSQNATGPQVMAFSCKDHGADAGDLSPTLRAMGHGASHANAGGQVAVAFDWQSGGDSRGLDPRPTAQLQRSQVPAMMQGMAVRRLTPVECERLQGFPDDYTRIPWRGKPAEDCPDGPRYKALGNSMAVPVMSWIGRRIEMVNAVAAREAAA